MKRDLAKQTFGKCEGQTIPQTLFKDPDWFFWAMDEGAIYGQFAKQAAIAERRAQRIILRDRDRGSYEFEWVFDHDGRFCRIEIVHPDDHGSGYSCRTEFLDLSFLRSKRPHDKLGYKRLIRQTKVLLFDDVGRMTRRRCERFFSDPRNFG